jgi:hypothetical protein
MKRQLKLQPMKTKTASEAKIPSAVMARAKAAVESASPKKPIPPPHQPRKTIAREKVIAALKKLHPMD